MLTVTWVVTQTGNSIYDPSSLFINCDFSMIRLQISCHIYLSNRIGAQRTCEAAALGLTKLEFSICAMSRGASSFCVPSIRFREAKGANPNHKTEHVARSEKINTPNKKGRPMCHTAGEGHYIVVCQVAHNGSECVVGWSEGRAFVRRLAPFIVKALYDFSRFSGNLTIWQIQAMACVEQGKRRVECATLEDTKRSLHLFPPNYSIGSVHQLCTHILLHSKTQTALSNGSLSLPCRFRKWQSHEKVFYSRRPLRSKRLSDSVFAV